MRRFLGLQSTGAGTGWQFENLLCTEAAVTTLAVGGPLFSLRNNVLSAMVWWFASGFGWMRRLGARVLWKCASSGYGTRGFRRLLSTGAGTGWMFENLICTEAAATTLAVGVSCLGNVTLFCR